jgi:uncharacterized membrane protein
MPSTCMASGLPVTWDTGGDTTSCARDDQLVAGRMRVDVTIGVVRARAPDVAEQQLGTRREALREYLHGALWALPTLSVLIALVLGAALSTIAIGAGSLLDPVLFQGTADDARQLLTAIAAAVLTVIAVVLGLTVVALQVASSQFSPRLLRNFLRDRANQVVLSVFVATFAYSMAGLYTVGVHASVRTASYPRLAVTVAIALVFACLGALIYFVDHLAHSIQIDMIMSTVGRQTMAAIAEQPPGIGRRSGQEAHTQPPEWAMPVPAPRSGYVQAIYPEQILSAVPHDVTVRLLRAPGEHVAAGLPLAFVWQSSPGQSLPDHDLPSNVVAEAVVVGFERTMQQDPGFGLRQLVDIASKALSPGINDPYTAVQAVNWVKALLCKLAHYPLGEEVLHDQRSEAHVIISAPSFADYLDLACGQPRRYGAGEPMVARALLQLLRDVGMLVEGTERRELVNRQIRLVLADAEQKIQQPDDLKSVQVEADQILRATTDRSRDVAPTGDVG